MSTEPDQLHPTCQDWCANELEGFSCYRGPPESVEDCYRACLGAYQGEETRTQCGAEWIAIKDCQIELDCEDLFGDCDPLERAFDECCQLAKDRWYCEIVCPLQDLEDCVEQYASTGECEGASSGGVLPGTQALELCN